MSNEPRCGKCGGVMTPQNAKVRPELFLHDACLPEELRPALRRATLIADCTIETALLRIERKLNDAVRNINTPTSDAIIDAMTLLTGVCRRLAAAAVADAEDSLL